MKTFQEFLSEATHISDPKGPGKGKKFSDMSDEEHNQAIEYHKAEFEKEKSNLKTNRPSHNVQNHMRTNSSHHSKNTPSLGGNFGRNAINNYHINKMVSHQDYLEDKA